MHAMHIKIYLSFQQLIIFWLKNKKDLFEVSALLEEARSLMCIGILVFLSHFFRKEVTVLSKGFFKLDKMDTT